MTTLLDFAIESALAQAKADDQVIYVCAGPVEMNHQEWYITNHFQNGWLAKCYPGGRVEKRGEIAIKEPDSRTVRFMPSNRSGSKLDTLTLQEIQDILNQEISWSAEAKLPEGITPQFRQGFIKGLEQARYLLEKAIAVVQQEE